MTTTEFAKMIGTTRASVIRAVRDGLIPAKAVRWKGKRGGRRTLEIIDPDAAMRSWTPRTGPAATGDEAGRSVELNDDASAADARRVREIFLAKQARLDFEVASDKLIDREVALGIFGKQVLQARNAFWALPNKLRARCPHLTVADGLVLEEMIREVLADLAAGPPEKASRHRKGAQ